MRAVIGWACALIAVGLLGEGTTYTGAFKNGKPEGHGAFTFRDGYKHVGDFKDGRFGPEIVGNRLNIAGLNLLLLDPL